MSTTLPTINTDALSEEQKASADFQFVYRGMLAQLCQPGFGRALCMHEAAHLFYFSLIGNTSYDAHPASIYFSSKTRRHEGNLAAVQLHDLKPHQEGQFWQWFDIVARAHVAGGVVGRKLSPTTDGGDQDDKERFERICAVLNSNPGISINATEVWMAAQKQVTEDITEPEVWAAIETQADALQLELGL
jgi:hypothetical protein